MLIVSGVFSTLFAQENNTKIKVGVFNGNGASPVCVIETKEALKIDPDMSIMEISASDIMQDKLMDLDALVFPGGSGSKEFNNLGQLAAEKVKEFARTKNKGVVGICAGGYLFSTTPTYPSLEILGAPDTREYYDRGRGLIAFDLNEKGREIFFELANYDTLFVQYYDGPIFVNPEKYNLTVLGEIRSDIVTKKDYPVGFTPGKPAFFTKKYGEGNIFVSVGHPEATPGMRWIVPRMVRSTLGKELITYDSRLIRPEINSEEILYLTEQKKEEKKYYWQLFDESEELVLNALESLYSLRSRPSVRWAIGLLRHHSPAVRMEAANYLYITEYTAALDDLEACLEVETVLENKEQLQKILNAFNQFVGSENQTK